METFIRDISTQIHEFIVMVYAPKGRRFLGCESKAAAFMFLHSSTSSYVTNIQ